jgi:protein associated with RNAse G/E
MLDSEGSVHIRFTKWDGTAHWTFDMERIGDDEHGIWLWAASGTELRRGAGRRITARDGFVKLVAPGAWWTAIWNDPEDASIDVYVDIITPAVWDGDTVRMVDLDLDVIRDPQGIVTVADEDEFDEHRVLYGYPDHLVAKARAVTARVAIAVERRDEPFGSVGERWLEVGRGR